MSRVEDINRVYEHLEDIDSRRVFNAWLEYGFRRDDNVFLEAINENKKISLAGFDSFFRNIDKPKLIVYGCGHDGRFARRLLERSGYTVHAFCDSNTVSTRGGHQCVDGLEVLTYEELCDCKLECVVLVASRKWYQKIYSKLIMGGFQYNQIFLPLCYADYLVGTVSHQYFDFFKPKEREIFVDAGSFNGMTTVEFAEWAGPSYSGAYLYEPSKANEKVIRSNLAAHNINQFELFLKGTWDSDCKLSFDGTSTPGGSVGVGDDLVEMTSIDSTLRGREVTYIKMDIEGSESRALIGAKETISKWKPRLAICVYHKPTDFLDIPLQIMEMDLGYHFAMRQYTTLYWETVLYAWVEM